MEGAAPTSSVEAPKVMAGLEGGSSSSSSSSSSGGFFSAIASLFRDVKQEAEAAGQDFQDYTLSRQSQSQGAVDYSERMAKFQSLSKDEQKLRSAAATLSNALLRTAAGHDSLAQKFKIESKAFADKSAAIGIQDGVVDGQAVLDSPKDGLEAARFAQAAARQTRAAEALRKLNATLEELSQTMLVFHDKILNDVYESVKAFRRAQLALDGARGDAELLVLQANLDKAKEAVDVKMLLLTEKRYTDLKKISNQIHNELVACIKESQAIFQ